MKVTEGKPTDFVPDKNNANQGTQRGQKMIQDSLQEDGAGRGIVVDKNDNVVAGNKTIESAVAIGIDKAIIVETTGNELVITKRLDWDLYEDESPRRYAFRDNRASEVSLNWSPEQLLLDKEAGVDFSGLFYENEFDEITAEVKKEPPPDPGPQIDKAAELQEKWGTALGQIWQIGPHRIACGDCTDRVVVEGVMRGERSELLFTSPPYGAARDYGGDDISILKLKKFISVFAEFANFMAINLGLLFKDGEVIQYWDEYVKEARSVGLKLLGWNVWDKKNSGSIASATNMFALIHEWIFVFGEKRKRLNRMIPNNLETYIERHGEDFLSGMKNKKVRQKDGAINETTSVTYTHHQLHSVLSCDSEKSREFTDYHPAIMRIDVPVAYIEAMTNKGDLVIDPFLGSGTTMTAAHQLNRRCIGIEIDSGYTAVVLERMKNLGVGPIKLIGQW